MRCFFLGHSFGTVQVDGFQYCSRCGEAKQPSITTIPHPCVNGHIWEDEYTQEYSTRYISGLSGGVTHGKQIQYFQKCKKCGAKRSITV